MDAEYLRAILHYDPQTGLFRWRVRRSNRHVGEIAGGSRGKDKRKRIGIDGKKYYSARLAWLYVTGEWPDQQIDHKDCNPSIDRFDNLRPADKSENAQNMLPRVDNKSGKTGVSWSSRDHNWRAQIGFHGQRICLGSFPTVQIAAAAYEAAKKELHKFSPYARHPGEIVK